MHPTHLLLSTESGLAALVPTAEALLAQGQQLVLLASIRSSQQVPLAEPWFDLKNRYLSKLTLLFFTEDQKQTLEIFDGGLTAQQLRELSPGVWQPAELQQCYLAGEADFVSRMRTALVTLNIPGAKITKVELPDAREASARHNKSAGNETQTAVSVSLWLYGRQYAFDMPKNGTTVLEAAESAGLDLPFSCRGGVCSTCRTTLVVGQVEMADNQVLDAWELEQGFILTCQAVPKSETLELDFDQT